MCVCVCMCVCVYESVYTPPSEAVCSTQRQFSIRV